MDRAVHGRLHARGAARFQRVFRVVEPDVDARHQPPGERDVVVLNQEQPPGKRRLHGVFVQLADQGLTAHIARVGLAGVEQNDRALVVVEQRGKARRIAEQQRGAFVGGEAPREPNNQGVSRG